jgi:pimeloyl-ACP methyl ester carboxylesterase
MSNPKNFFEEYVPINGIRQYFLHYPASDGEVMLVIHGGPGQSEVPFAYYAEPEPAVYTAVYYDQRGAGKTLREHLLRWVGEFTQRLGDVKGISRFYPTLAALGYH